MKHGLALRGDYPKFPNSCPQRERQDFRFGFAPLSIRLGVLTIAFAPFIASLAWPLVYILYGISILLFMFSDRRKTRLVVNPILICNWIVMSVVLLSHLRDIPSVVNICSLFFAMFAMCTSFCSVEFTERIRVVTFRMILTAALFVTLGGIILSVAIPNRLGLIDALQSFNENGRLTILVPDFGAVGHSALVYYSFVILLLAVSNVVRLRFMARAILVIISLIMVALTGAAVAILAAGAVGVVLTVELLPTSLFIKTLCNVVVLFALIIAASVPSVLQAALETVRYHIQGKDAGSYGDDITAGRTFLNELLSDGISRSPIFGLGHSDELINYGTAVADLNMTGVVGESGLHTAAKYGIPYFLTLVALALSPLRTLVAGYPSYRICGVGLTLGVIIFSGANAIEVAHESEYVLFFSLLTLLGAPNLFKR